jgi:hypothetical protein
LVSVSVVSGRFARSGREPISFVVCKLRITKTRLKHYTIYNAYVFLLSFHSIVILHPTIISHFLATKSKYMRYVFFSFPQFCAPFFVFLVCLQQNDGSISWELINLLTNHSSGRQYNYTPRFFLSKTTKVLSAQAITT